jgi:peptidoglycan hydrolase-like protein with peptidoglycan-binding domain
VTSVADTGCASGNKFSTTTGRNCVAAGITASDVDAGCISGNKFSTTTGRNCGSQAGVAANASSNAFGQKVRMITINLNQGSRGSHVTTLQQFLISEDTGRAAQALAANGATENFGALTRAALAEFQASVGISPAFGNFGAITRAYISSHY